VKKHFPEEEKNMKNNINIDIFEKEINETYQKYNFLYANGQK